MRHFWLDRIVHLEPGVRATGIKGVALAEPEFDAHFPGNPVLPGIYLLEGLAQAAGVLIERSLESRKVALLVSVDRARFLAFARPGDQVRLEAELEALDEESARARVTALVGERTLASARLAFRLMDPSCLIPQVYQPFWRQMIETWLGHYPEVGGA